MSLTINQVSKVYGKKVALNQLSLELEDGKIYGLIGRNGAGKTTTIKCIAGIHSFEEGEILVDGFSVKTDTLACKQRIAYIPDNPDLYELSFVEHLLDSLIIGGRCAVIVPQSSIHFNLYIFW